MSSALRLTCADLAALIRRGLGGRVRDVRCVIGHGDLRFLLDKLDLAGWLPRVGMEIAIVPVLEPGRQEMILRWKVIPSSIIGIIAAPLQRLGAGTRIIDALIDHLGWREAVISRDDEVMILDLKRLAPMQRLGIRVQSLVIADPLQIGISLQAYD